VRAIKRSAFRVERHPLRPKRLPPLPKGIRRRSIAINRPVVPMADLIAAFDESRLCDDEFGEVDEIS
jgi:hypothetical protein